MAWTPSTTGQYVGTWFFLFVLGFIARGLTAVKIVADRYWFQKYGSLNIVVASTDKVDVVTGTKIVQTFRTYVDIPRATLVMITQGVYYLLFVPF
jgi:hypothetical protein